MAQACRTSSSGSRVSTLKPYAKKFEDAKVKGEAMLTITSEVELADCGVSIDVEVDKYCLLLNLARVRAHARDSSQPHQIDCSKASPNKPKRAKANKPRIASKAALGSVEMEQVARASSDSSVGKLIRRGVC